MGSFSMGHWLIVLLVVVLVFGTKKLRNIGKDLGGAVSDFKHGLKSGEEATSGNNTTQSSNATAPNVIEGEVQKKD